MNSFDPFFDKSLWVFLDGVHDLCGDEELPDLKWIPQALPPGCRLVVSCTRGSLTPEALSHLDAAQSETLRWQAAKDADVKYLVDQWLLSARRKLTSAQESAVDAVWAATSSPLCVRLTVHDALRWSSFEVYTAAHASAASHVRRFRLTSRMVSCPGPTRSAIITGPRRYGSRGGPR